MTKSREANWIGHILRRNWLLKHFVEKKGRRKNRSDGKTRNNQTQRERTSSHSFENSLWKRMWICLRRTAE